MNGRITNTRIVDAPMLPGRMKQDQAVMRHNKVHYHGGNPGRQTPYPCRPYLRLLPGRYQPVQGVTDNKEGLQSQYESSTVMNSSNGTFLSKNPFSDKPIRCNDGFIKAQMDNLTVCSKSRSSAQIRIATPNPPLRASSCKRGGISPADSEQVLRLQTRRTAEDVRLYTAGFSLKAIFLGSTVRHRNTVCVFRGDGYK